VPLAPERGVGWALSAWLGGDSAFRDYDTVARHSFTTRIVVIVPESRAKRLHKVYGSVHAYVEHESWRLIGE